jgi:hypothetical protein
MEIFIIWLLFGIVCMVIASAKNRNGCGWFILGCLFGPFALVVAALPSLSDDVTGPTPETHLKCPDCRELVLKDARKCKHCGCHLKPQL